MVAGPKLIARLMALHLGLELIISIILWTFYRAWSFLWKFKLVLYANNDIRVGCLRYSLSIVILYQHSLGPAEGTITTLIKDFLGNSVLLSITQLVAQKSCLLRSMAT